MEKLKAINWQDVVKRAAWTFVQAFVAVFLIAGESIIDALFAGDWEGLQTLAIATAISGVAAGLSAVKSVALELLRQIREG